MEQIPNNESTEVLDSRWYKRFESLTFEPFEYLDGDASHRTEQKRKFIEGEILCPDLDYPKLDEFDFEVRETALLNLKNDIIETEVNSTVIEIYRTKINEKLAELRMLKMAKLGDDRKFAKYARFVYGIPDKENTAQATDIVAAKVLGHEGVSVEDRQEFEMLKAEQADYFATDVSVEPVKIKGRVSSLDEVVVAFEEALAEVNAEGWNVVVANNKSITNFRVSQEKKTVVVPDNKGDMLNRRLEALIQHEIHGHVRRRVNGEASRLQLLGLGLDRVEKGEEGVATYLEQNVAGADSPIHPERYFAIALATGVVDGVARDFRQTYEVLEKYYKNTLKSGEDLDERAKNSAWSLTVRVFRGTTGRTPGAVFTKDLAYFEGNKETWALVNSNEQIVKYFSCGKFDAANSRHVGWLVSLGIADEELQNITNNASL